MKTAGENIGNMFFKKKKNRACGLHWPSVISLGPLPHPELRMGLLFELPGKSKWPLWEDWRLNFETWVPGRGPFFLVWASF